MSPPTKRLPGARRRLGRPHLAILSVAALLGAGAANTAFNDAATPVAPAESISASANAAASNSPPTVTEEAPQPVTVDAQLIRSIARQVLEEQNQPEHLTNLDLIARDVLAGGPVSPADVQHVTRETMLGRGPGGPVDAPAPPPPGCPPTARACIDVDGKMAWMLSDGQVSYGPVPVATGRPGYETTRGTHHVLRHVRHDHSIPFDSPMPYSTYFTTSGIAFHEGRLDEPSHGCIHLAHHTAAHFFNQLKTGDEVVAF